MNIKLKIISLQVFAALSSLALFSSCSDPRFKQFGSSMLSSTGMVSASSADALFEAGNKISKAASPLSDREEYYLGRGVSATILSKYAPSKNTSLNSYVNKVANVVAAYSTYPETYDGYHAIVIDTDEVNAASAPGGFIFVSKGLLKLLKSEDELAAVIAHEVGHIALKHGVSAVSQSNLTSAVTLLGKEAASSYAGSTASQLTSLFGDSVQDVTDTVLTKGYSRSLEYDADKYAGIILANAGYNPQALVTVLETLKANEGQGSSAGLFATHPEAGDRIDEVKGELPTVNPNPGIIVRTQRFAAVSKG